MKEKLNESAKSPVERYFMVTMLGAKKDNSGFVVQAQYLTTYDGKLPNLRGCIGEVMVSAPEVAPDNVSVLGLYEFVSAEEMAAFRTSREG